MGYLCIHKLTEVAMIEYIERLLQGAEVQWKTLGEVADIVGRIGFRGYTNKDFVEKQQGAITISPANIKNQSLIIDDTCKYISWEKYEESPEIKVEVGDILLAKTASVGKVALVNSLEYPATINPQLVLLKRCKILPAYLCYYMTSFAFQNNLRRNTSSGTVPNISQSLIKKLLIPIPPLSVQREIVRILDKFTELEAELESELECRRKQYGYYRDKLLSEKYLLARGKVEWRTLGDVGEFIRGSGLQKSDLTTEGVPAIHYGQIYTYYGTYTEKTKSYVSEIFATKKRKASYGDLIIATTSENDEDVCKAVAWLGKSEVVVSSDACFYHHCMVPKYISYFFQTDIFQLQKRNYITGTKVRRVNANDLAKIKIPIPPLSVQEEIVRILDKFDTLTTSISEGLPREIELRRKQYEYYRERLLSFDNDNA